MPDSEPKPADGERTKLETVFNEKVGDANSAPPSPTDAKKEAPEAKDVTQVEWLKYITNFIATEKPGIKPFYPDSKLKDISPIGTDMVNKLRKKGCGKETSKQLSVLCLYDVVMLIDDSTSMKDEEEETRIVTLAETMKKITMVYDLARPKQGLVSVKFINAMNGYKDITSRKAPYVLKDRGYWGTTQIGSALQKKVIDNFVFNPKKKLTRPLLIMTITDGEPEGESRDYLRKVIDKCVAKLGEEGGLGTEAVSFHFSRVGNDERAAALLSGIDKCCPTVDCLRAEYALERFNDKDKDSQWHILPKLLLGAIVTTINQNDEELSGKDDIKPSQEPVKDAEDLDVVLPDGEGEGEDEQEEEVVSEVKAAPVSHKKPPANDSNADMDIGDEMDEDELPI